LEALKAEGPLGGVILDLRGNGGGLLDAAVATVGCFVPKGTEVVRTRGRGAMEEKIYKTTAKPILPDVPLAILVDGGTASSSEITAGALQDL
ncbi:peptidase, partial [Xanthomonas citri pv. citri]|nr:peptidase [Xanthomonas citri pv. citri]